MATCGIGQRFQVRYCGFAGGIGGGTTRGGSAVNAAGSRMSAELAALATAPGPSMQPKLSVKKQGQAKSTGGGGDEGSASALGKLGGNGGKTSDAMSDSKSGATKGRPLIEEDLVVEGSSIVVNKVAAAAGAAGKAAASVVAAASPLAEDAASTLLEAASTVTSAAGANRDPRLPDRLLPNDCCRQAGHIHSPMHLVQPAVVSWA